MRLFATAGFALATVCRAQDTVPLPVAPEWQIAAGGRMAFDVASVQPAASGSYVSAGFPLDAGNGYRFTGGRFSATFPLFVYIMFAWKLTLTPGEIDALLARLPKWVGRESFQIQARAPVASDDAVAAGGPVPDVRTLRDADRSRAGAGGGEAGNIGAATAPAQRGTGLSG